MRESKTVTYRPSFGVTKFIMSKITIITPCKNGESHLIPHIKGILSQTVKNLEYVFVNDGSTDKTEDIILSYKSEFKKKGWDFHYIKQESKGQAAAVNQGLKIMTGDYFSCIDSDDIVLSTFCEELVTFLENNLQTSLVFSEAEYVKEKTFEHIKYASWVLPEGMVDNYFDEMLLPNSISRPPFACFMIRRADFEKIYPDYNIYEGTGGQNPQLIMPFAYAKKIGYVKKCLFKYVIRENSSSNVNSVAKKYINYHNWEDLYCNVLKNIPNMKDYEKAYYLWKIKTLWADAIKDVDPNPNTNTKYYQLLKYLSEEKNKRIVFWGASLFLVDFLEKCTLANNNIIGIIDKNSDKIGKKLNNYKIFSPNDLKVLDPDIIIVTVVNSPMDCVNTVNKLLITEDMCKIIVKTID